MLQIFATLFVCMLISAMVGYWVGQSSSQFPLGMRSKLRRVTRRLHRAVDSAQLTNSQIRAQGDRDMANPILGTFTAEVTETIGVIQSATVLINGFKAKLEDAVAAALANGATETELQPLVDLAVALDTESAALAAAVAANT